MVRKTKMRSKRKVTRTRGKRRTRTRSKRRSRKAGGKRRTRKAGGKRRTRTRSNRRKMKGGVPSLKKFAGIFKKYNVDEDVKNDSCNAITPHEKCIRDDRNWDEGRVDSSDCIKKTKDDRENCLEKGCYYSKVIAEEGMPPCISNRNEQRIHDWAMNNNNGEKQELTDKEKITKTEFLKRRST